MRERIHTYLQQFEKQVLMVSHGPVRVLGHINNAVVGGLLTSGHLDPRFWVPYLGITNIVGFAATWGPTVYYGVERESRVRRVVDCAFMQIATAAYEIAPPVSRILPVHASIDY